MLKYIEYVALWTILSFFKGVALHYSLYFELWPWSKFLITALCNCGWPLTNLSLLTKENISSWLLTYILTAVAARSTECVGVPPPWSSIRPTIMHAQITTVCMISRVHLELRSYVTIYRTQGNFDVKIIWRICWIRQYLFRQTFPD